MDLFFRQVCCSLWPWLFLFCCLGLQSCAERQQADESLRVAALDGGHPSSVLGRWQADGEIFVFAADGRLFRHKGTVHTRQRYRWDAANGVLLLGATQMYYPEREAVEMASAFGGEEAFQSALDRSYCVEIEALSKQSAQVLNLDQTVGKSLVFRPPVRSALEDMMLAVSTQQGLNRRRLQVEDALRLSPAPL